MSYETPEPGILARVAKSLGAVGGEESGAREFVPWYEPEPEPMTTLTATTQFLEDTRLWIFDADGTLRRCTAPGQPCPNNTGEWELMPEAVEFLRPIDWEESEIAIVSNQGGVAYGYLSDGTARRLLRDLCEALEDTLIISPEHIYLDVCMEADPGAPCRKPNPGMLVGAMSWYGHLYDMSLEQAKRCAVMVGDRPEDRDAARNAGIRFCWAQELFGVEL